MHKKENKHTVEIWEKCILIPTVIIIFLKQCSQMTEI